jgi:type IV pilus assembly protein PilC
MGEVTRRVVSERTRRIVPVGPSEEVHLPGMRRIPIEVVCIFTRQLATMLQAGIPLNRGLGLLSEQDDHPRFARIVLDLNRHLLIGHRLSQGLQTYPECFPALYVGMVRMAEAHGDLGHVLSSLADYLERDRQMRQKLAQAISYPAFVLAFTALFGFIIFEFLLPHFVDIFDGLHVVLPLLTRILVSLVHITNHPWWSLLASLFVFSFIYSLRCWLMAPEGRLAWDRLKIRLPLIGPPLRQLAIARFARSLALMLSGGAPLLKAMATSGAVSGNAVYEKSLGGAHKFLREGSSLSEFFESLVPLFPMAFAQMVNVGEESGELETVLNKIAAFYEVEVEQALATFMAAIEPLLVMMTGTIVGLVVLAIFLPLYSLLNQM